MSGVEDSGFDQEAAGNSKFQTDRLQQEDVRTS